MANLWQPFCFVPERCRKAMRFPSSHTLPTPVSVGSREGGTPSRIDPVGPGSDNPRRRRPQDTS